MGKLKIKLSSKITVTFTLLIICLQQVNAQQISIDRGVRAEGLWCFPLTTDSLVYLYLPDKGLLGSDENNKPQFSFIRYVNDVLETTTSDNTITKADGGAILHFLVTYDTDEKKILRAEAKLRELFSNDKIKLRGPVIFKEGRYALVSSIINPDNGKEEKKLMSIGAAPVLQGSRIALSFELDPVRATLLLNSLKMTTPDVSIVFDMTFSGIMDAYNAKLIVDWTEVNKGQKISAGGSYYFFSADLELIYAELRRTSAIRLETSGEDANMQKIVDAAYARVMDMIFQKVEPENLPASDQSDLSLLNGLMGKGGDGGNKMVPFSAHAAYKRKNIKTSGFSTLQFNSRNSTDRHHYITFNISDFYKKYGTSDEYIRTVSLYAPELDKRIITVGVDGSLLPEFDKMINNVTVTLRKRHDNGSTTVREVSIKKASLEKDPLISLNYLAVGDTNRTAWLNYEYMAQFSFVGGRNWQTGWITQNSAMINLLTPYERRIVKIEGDPATLQSRNVRATTIKIEYPFLDGNRTLDMTVKPNDDLSQKQFEITMPIGKSDYKYTIRWQLNDGTVMTTTGETDMGILFIDNMPAR
jgi:hypothetical protein